MAYNKYGNIKTIIDGIVFDSKSEAGRYCELKLLLKADKIFNLRLQPRFLLQEKFRDSKKKSQGKIEYVADFYYFDNETKTHVVEDVKGHLTDVYRLKKKLFLYKFPKIDFREVF